MATEQEVREVLYDVIDPELNINIMDLGLVYRVEVKEGVAEVDFSLTYPGCPLGDVITNDIVTNIRSRTDVDNVMANLVWQPPWGPERMSENARLMFGYPI